VLSVIRMEQKGEENTTLLHHLFTFRNYFVPCLRRSDSLCRFEVLDEEPGDDDEGGGQRLLSFIDSNLMLCI
jgi:hypothetical protein